MKKLTVLAALMLLVSLSTVFAVRTHQRNLSQLTAQNIEALSDGEGGPWWKEAASAINAFIHAFDSDYFDTMNSSLENCKYTHKEWVGAGVTYESPVGPLTFDEGWFRDVLKDGKEVFCVGYGTGCLRQYCNDAKKIKLF